MSVEVATLTTEPNVVAPMVKPSMVTLKGAGEIVAPIVVMIIYVAVVRLQDPERSLTMLLPAAITGVMDAAKNDAG